MKNNLKTISIAGGLFLSMILMFLLVNRLWDKQDLETSIYKQAGLPEEEWLRELQSTVTDDGKMIKNAYENFSIAAPLSGLTIYVSLLVLFQGQRLIEDFPGNLPLIVEAS